MGSLVLELLMKRLLVFLLSGVIAVLPGLTACGNNPGAALGSLAPQR